MNTTLGREGEMCQPNSNLESPNLKPISKTFFLPNEDKNHLVKSREHMLKVMKRYSAWNGMRVVELLTFPHYDSRPLNTSFPHSAQKYLNGTDENGNFNQGQPTLLVSGEEPKDVCCIREQSNSQKIPVLLIA